MTKKTKLDWFDKFLIGTAIGVFAIGPIGYLTADNKPKDPAPVVRTIEQKPEIKLENKVNQYFNPISDGDFSKDSDIMLLARAIYGEARGGSDELKIAVAYSVLNRVRKNTWYGKTTQEVILKPFQYSCFNKNDPNFEKLKNPLKYETKEVWKECYEIAENVLNNKLEDITAGSTHYHTISVSPNWAKGRKPARKIGNTLFYNSVN